MFRHLLPRRHRRAAALGAGGLAAVVAVSAALTLTGAGPDDPSPTTSAVNPSKGAASTSTAQPAFLQASSKAWAKAGKPIKGSYVVRFVDGPHRKPAQLKKAAHRLTGRVGGRVTGVYSATLHGFSVKMNAQQAKAMARQAGVASVQQDRTIAALGDTSGDTSSDTAYQAGASWALDRMDQPNLPLSGTYDYDSTGGAGANIFVLDTGVRTTHQDFGGRAQASGPNPGDAQDCEGHGTAVASLAAGSTYGIAKKAKVFGIRVLGCGDVGATTDALGAIDWVTKNAPRPAVVNMSWGINFVAADLDDAVKASIASGITYVIAGGNSAENACSHSPQSVTQAIVVGASDANDNRSSYSAVGPCVDLFAPGNDIPSAAWTSDTATTVAGGTSFSAPLTTGVVALYLSKHPSATPAQVSAALAACAKHGILGDAGTGSPNLLINSRCGSSGLTLSNPGKQLTTVAQKVSLPITATGATGALTYKATGLPDGITINSTTGTITGAATSSADTDTVVTVTATDSTGATSSETFQWSLIVGVGYVHGVGGYCLDDDNSRTDPGTKIQIHLCNQNWQLLMDGTIHFIHRDATKCVSAAGADSADGQLVVLNACDGGSDQVWKQDSTGQLVNPATGKCLTAPRTAQAVQLTLATCTGADGQKWQLPSGLPDTVTFSSSPGNQVSIRGAAVSRRVRAVSTLSTTTFTYTATGLPDGLSLDHTSGLITGTPTTHQDAATVTVTATGSSGVTASTTFTWKVADGPIAGASSRCADDYYGKVDDGNPVTVWGCDPTTDTQAWTARPDGTFEVKGACLSVTGTAAAGALVGVGPCDSAETWSQKGNAVVESSSGLCLNAPSFQSATQFTLATCDGSTRQWWHLPTTSGDTSVPTPTSTDDPTPTSDPSPTDGATPTASPTSTGGPTTSPDPTPTGTTAPTPTATDPTGAIVHPSADWCADVRNQVVGLWDCNNSDPQKYTVRGDGRLVNQTLCVTPSADGVVMAACDSNDDSQVWAAGTGGTVVNQASQKCLTASQFGYTAPFKLAACTGDTTQLWSLPAA